MSILSCTNYPYEAHWRHRNAVKLSAGPCLSHQYVFHFLKILSPGPKKLWNVLLLQSLRTNTKRINAKQFVMRNEIKTDSKKLRNGCCLGSWKRFQLACGISSIACWLLCPRRDLSYVSRRPRWSLLLFPFRWFTHSSSSHFQLKTNNH